MPKATNVNIDCTTRKSSELLFEVKTLLLANGWTIVGTSDATNFTNGASPDNVSTVALFDVSNAWYVLADPAGLVWLYVQRRATNSTFTVKVSRVAPQANGTATALPTCAVAANEVTIVNNVTFATSVAAPRGHVITYDAAENTAGIRPVYVMMTQGTSTLCGGFFIEAAANGTYASSNPHPWCVGWATGNNSLASQATPNIAWTYYYSPASVWVPLTALSEPMSWTTNAVSIAGGTGSGVDPWLSQDSALPIALGRNTTLAQPGIWGVLKNIRWRTVARNYPDTLTTSGSDRFVYAGNAVVPYADGVTPL
jgi:hypothetical protein